MLYLNLFEVKQMIYNQSLPHCACLLSFLFASLKRCEANKKTRAYVKNSCLTLSAPTKCDSDFGISL